MRIAMRWAPLAEWVGFQLVWFTCALSSARGSAWPGILAALVFVAVTLGLKRLARSEIVLVAASAGLGVVLETAFVAAGLLRYAAPWPSDELAPAWIVALWLAFGATMTTLSRWLGHRAMIKAAILGALSAPLAYWAAARLGALQIVGPTLPTVAVVSLAWAVALSILIAIARNFDRSHKSRAGAGPDVASP